MGGHVYFCTKRKTSEVNVSETTGAMQEQFYKGRSLAYEPKPNTKTVL